MKHLCAILALGAILILSPGKETIQEAKTPLAAAEGQISQSQIGLLSKAQQVWLKKLEQCESSGNPKAINKVDRDGTPSYGLLQFKPSTFKAFTKQYGIKGNMMDPDAQEAIVVQMILHGVDWAQQFPDCTSARHIGHPPRLSP